MSARESKLDKFFFVALSAQVQHIVSGSDAEETADFLSRFYGERVSAKQLTEIDPEKYGGRESLEKEARKNHRFAV